MERRKSHTSDCSNGAAMVPEAPSTWAGMTRPVPAWMQFITAETWSTGS